MMRFVLIALLSAILFATSAMAQNNMLTEGREGEILSQPVCGVLVNKSEQTIMGTVSTAPQMIGGDIIRHRDNFRLEAGERKEICARGPFYEGRRLEIVLRTIIPLFDCKTRLDRGEIALDVTVKDSGFRTLTATCH